MLSAPPVPALPPTQGNVHTRRGDGRVDHKRLVTIANCNFSLWLINHYLLIHTISCSSLKNISSGTLGQTCTQGGPPVTVHKS